VNRKLNYFNSLSAAEDLAYLCQCSYNYKLALLQMAPFVNGCSKTFLLRLHLLLMLLQWYDFCNSSIYAWLQGAFVPDTHLLLLIQKLEKVSSDSVKLTWSCCACCGALYNPVRCTAKRTVGGAAY